MEVVKTCKHIRFVKSDDEEIYWLVFANKDDVWLGTIEYFPRWKCYVFAPEGGTVFETSCLDDITMFLIECNEGREAEGK